MSRSTGFLLLAAVAASALALVGCAPTAHSAKPPSAHKVSSAPSATPTPTPTAAAAPTSLVGTNCAQLETLPALDAVFPHHVTAQPFGTYLTDEGAPLFADLVPLQLGALDCFWADGPFQTAPDSEFAVQVWPNATAEFNSDSSTLSKHDDAATGYAKSVPKWGDSSFTDCQEQDGECIFDILVGSYWIHIDEFNTETSVPVYPESGAEKTILNAVVTGIHALAAPASGWTVPSDAAGVPNSCASVLTAAQVESAIGYPKAGTVVSGWGGTTFDTALDTAANLLVCSWNPDPNYSELGLRVEILPGSAYEWTTTPPPSSPSESISAISGVPHEAWGGCQAQTVECVVYGEVDSSWIELTIDYQHTTLAKAETLMSAILAEAT